MNCNLETDVIFQCDEKYIKIVASSWKCSLSSSILYPYEVETRDHFKICLNQGSSRGLSRFELRRAQAIIFPDILS